MAKKCRPILAIVILAIAILACRRATADEVRFYTPTASPAPVPTAYATLIVFITAQPAVSDTAYFVVSGGDWNCRESPGGKIVAYASIGQVVRMIDARGGWIKVDLAGRQCWLRKSALK